jgi:Rod binding domain-containing protein
MIELKTDTSAPSPGASQSSTALREKAAEFEGILLAEILQKLSECYRIPDAEDSDPTSESFQSFAASALGGGLARSGGVGIGDMLVRSLSRDPIQPHPKESGEPADSLRKGN